MSQTCGFFDRCVRFTVYVSLVVVGVVSPVLAYGADRATTLAVPVEIAGAVRDGDVIAYDLTAGVYRPAETPGDEGMFGVVVDDPVLFLGNESLADLATSMRPVVTYGETYVNVTDIAGEIKAGDLVTSSRVVGTAQRFDRDTSGQILGFALEDTAYATSNPTIQVDGVLVKQGRVLVSLRIGYYDAARDHGKKVDELMEQLATLATSSGAGITESEGNGFDTFLLFRYILGSFVAITAVVLALRRFGDLFAQSIISVGRNPLARSQIRSILVWNAVLIVIVSGVGLGIGVAIIAL